jgi:hypothetical protein
MFQTSAPVMFSMAAATESASSTAPAESGTSWLEAAEPGGESQVKLLLLILRPKQELMMGIAARISWCGAKLLNR